MNTVPLINSIENQFLRSEQLPDFRAGDTIRVQVRIREGEKSRLQAFEGICIARSAGGNRSTFTVRKISYSVGVERIFADNSPNVEAVEVLAHGKVRQARLFYLRGLSGKAARIKERAYDKSANEDKKGRNKKRGTHRKAATTTPSAVNPADNAKAKKKAKKASKKAASKKAAEKAATPAATNE